MSKIEPTYVSFEQAKLLKEKGFNISLYNFYYQEKSNSTPVLTSGAEYQSDRDCKWDWNLNGGESGNQSSVIPYPNDTKGIYTSAPEQWQVVEWLRLNHGIWVYASPYYSRPDDNKTGKWIFEGFEPEVYFIKELEVGEEIATTFFLATYEHPQKAYSVAFDYILKELI